MKAPELLVALESSGPQDVALENVSFAYDGGAPIFRGLTLKAHPGDIIGVTGPVACGKSTLGRATEDAVFAALREYPAFPSLPGTFRRSA